MSVGFVNGTLRPIRDHVLVSDMEFSTVQTASGIYIPSQNGKSSGIKPRWGKVWAVGPEQKDVKVGDWICVAHGRWTRGITVHDKDGNEVVVRRVDNNDILMSAEEQPTDITFNDL